MARIKTDEPALMADGLFKYDLATGTRATLALPSGHVGYESSFVPRDGGVDEDDGYVVGFVTNRADMTSEFWITPSRAFADGPVARVKLPQKVPPKFHGRWVPADALTPQSGVRT
jgi:carotenoid cleavage dioxygenase